MVNVWCELACVEEGSAGSDGSVLAAGGNMYAVAVRRGRRCRCRAEWAGEAGAATRLA